MDVCGDCAWHYEQLIYNVSKSLTRHVTICRKRDWGTSATGENVLGEVHPEDVACPDFKKKDI